ENLILDPERGLFRIGIVEGLRHAEKCRECIQRSKACQISLRDAGARSCPGRSSAQVARIVGEKASSKLSCSKQRLEDYGGVQRGIPRSAGQWYEEILDLGTRSIDDAKFPCGKINL